MYAISFDRNRDYLYNNGEFAKQLKPYSHSGLNKQTPFLALFNNLGAYQNEEEDKTIVYGMPGIPDTVPIPTIDHVRFREMLYALQDGIQPTYFRKGKLYHVAKGSLYEVIDNKPIIHMLVTIDTEHIWELGEWGEGRDYSRFKLLVSSDFMFGTNHKVVVKKLTTDYFPLFTKHNIPIQIVADVTKECFVPITVRAASFSTIEERLEYFKTLNENVLYGTT